MAWWTGETSSRIVRDETGRVKSVFNYDEQFALFSSEEFREEAKHPNTLAKALAELPEGVRKPLLVAVCKAVGATYCDPSFPAALNSLYSPSDVLDEATKYEFRQLGWKRVGELYPGDKKVFDNIEPNDIHQGMLGDCYFLSSLSALAENPTRIECLFETADYDPTGCYKLHLFDMGQPIQVIIDDFLPVDSAGEVAFSGPKQEKGVTELWVVLLEKAWAKRFGSYRRIDAGYTNEALTDLTGAPCEIINLKPNAKIWKKILAADGKNYVITASSDVGAQEGSVSKQGLISLHAYAVIAAREISTSSGKEQLLMIRNPWGGQEWNGDWSDESPLWTEELKQELKWEKADDGRFWINFKDFCKNYTEVVICHVHDDYRLASSLVLSQTKGEFTVVQVTLQSSGHFYAIVNQIDGKRFPGEEYDVSPVRMIAARITGATGVEFLNGRVQTCRDSWLEVTGPAGDYLFFFQVDWIADSSPPVGVSVYTAQAVSLVDVTAKYQNFLQLVYSKKLAQSIPDNPAFKEARDVVRFSIKRFGEDADDVQMEGFLADVYENSGQSQRADVTGLHSKFQNVQLLPPFSGKEYKVAVQPREIVSVVKRVIDPYEDIQHQVKPSVKLQKT